MRLRARPAVLGRRLPNAERCAQEALDFIRREPFNNLVPTAELIFCTGV